MDKYSYLSNADGAVVDSMYRQYLENPASVEEGWQRFFEGFEFARINYSTDGIVPEQFAKEFKVLELINGYRTRGHLFTKTNPVRERRKYSPTLAIENFGLSPADLETTFEAGSEIGIGSARLKDIIAHLEQTYCQSIGVEYRYIRKPEKVQWLQERMESVRNTPDFSIQEKKEFLYKLNQAVVFEQFLGKKFIGQKRFSIEGAETLIPALDTVIEYGADEHGLKDIVIGMAHRGRLNVLANTLNKTYREIFSEFEGKDYDDALVEGDVKYHMGYSSRVVTNNKKKIDMTLVPNPSHLESVDGVVEGVARAIIENDHGFDDSQVLPILIHGDAAIAAQGVVYEVVQMASLKAYSTGGTVHIVINNQVGFTTNYLDARSSTYCTDVGKVTLSPVFHVNGDDVESLCFTMKLALDWRQRYKHDVFIDILCYRKHGHNEGDEPKFTQPRLYQAIAKHPNPRAIYIDKLQKNGEIEADLVKEMEKHFSEMLNQRLTEAKEIEKASITNFLADRWEGYSRAANGAFDVSPDTSVPKKTLMGIGRKISEEPAGKKVFRKLSKILADRRRMLEEDSLDWGMAELMAYGTILKEGHDVRFTGQDVERGTFSHRHAVIKVEDSEEEYIHLKHIDKKQGNFQIYNSLLSEYAVLAFEYGYALTAPKALTIWEAQFGDFVNGAQIILDQYLCAAEEKWSTMNGLVMLLPHGYEGMGAEHSSARMERFLGLCAAGNMIVANCTTPANFFHILRRQLAYEFRKPLVIFTPKSLLRHPRCRSSLSEMTKGGFLEVIDDPKAVSGDVNKVIFCQGKIYYELLEKQEEVKAWDTAVVRIEQLHPLPEKQLREVIDKYVGAKEHIWVQEEPRNMGAWSYLNMNFDLVSLTAITRPASGAPATGSSDRSAAQQRELVERAFRRTKTREKAKA
jgi:2-oxoglutarate dehydrogenase E1 component